MGAAMDRRGFVKRACWAAAGAFVGIWRAALGQEERGPSRVCLARANSFHLPNGYIDPEVVRWLLDRLITALTDEVTPQAGWRQFLRLNDRVAIQVAVKPTPARLEVVDGVVARLVRAGISPSNVIIFAADERDLFAAGYSLRRDGEGVKCYGAASEGYRGGITRILHDRATALINLAAMSPDPQVGLAGAIQNFINCIPPENAEAYLADDGYKLGEVHAKALVHQRTRLHIMDCMDATYNVPPEGGPSSQWPYGGIMMGEDPVALDTIAVAILEAKRKEALGREWPLEPSPTYLEVCDRELGLGTSDPESIELIKLGDEPGALV